MGVRVAMREGKPRLEKLWEAPAFSATHLTFRQHPSGVRLIEVAGEIYATVVEQKTKSGDGQLYVVRARDGAIVLARDLDGPGQRFAQPLWLDDTLFVTSCVHGNRGPSHIEAWRLEP